MHAFFEVFACFSLKFYRLDTDNDASSVIGKTSKKIVQNRRDGFWCAKAFKVWTHKNRRVLFFMLFSEVLLFTTLASSVNGKTSKKSMQKQRGGFWCVKALTSNFEQRKNAGILCLVFHIRCEIELVKAQERRNVSYSQPKESNVDEQSNSSSQQRTRQLPAPLPGDNVPRNIPQTAPVPVRDASALIDGMIRDIILTRNNEEPRDGANLPSPVLDWKTSINVLKSICEHSRTTKATA